MLIRRTKKKVLFIVIGFFVVCILLLMIIKDDSGTDNHSLRHEDDVTITTKSQLFMNTSVCGICELTYVPTKLSHCHNIYKYLYGTECFPCWYFLMSTVLRFMFILLLVFASLLFQ